MGRGGRLDAHSARAYLTLRLACEVARLYPTENSFGGDPELPRLARAGANARCASLSERRVIPSPQEFASCLGTSPYKRTSADINIWMKCAKKPLSQKGAYLIVRDRIAEGVLTKQFADLPQPKIKDFRPGTPSFAPAENQRFSPGDPDAPSADNRDIWMQNAKAPLFR